MRVKHQDQEYEICPALAVIVCKLIGFCDEYNLPLEIIDSNEWMIKFSTLGWTDQLVYKYQYHTRTDYSDLGLTGIPLCAVTENTIEIIVNRDKKIEKFNKE